MVAPHTAQVAVRSATADDLPGIAAVFGRAFEDYQRGLGVGPDGLARLWESSLAGRLSSTRVAVLPDGRLAGFITTVKPGETERYGQRGEASRRFTRWRQTIGWKGFWRPPALFIPMGLAYAQRHSRRNELYVSLIAVDPPLQGRGVGQALLGAAEEEGRASGAAAVLLHTASTNEPARRAYARAGYELVCTVRAPWRGPAGIPAFVALRKSLGPEPTPRLDKLGY